MNGVKSAISTSKDDIDLGIDQFGRVFLTYIKAASDSEVLAFCEAVASQTS